MKAEEMVDLKCRCGADFQYSAYVAHMITSSDHAPRCPACSERIRAAAKAEETRLAPIRRREAIDAALATRLPEEYHDKSFEALAALDPVERAKRVKDPTGIARAMTALSERRIVISGPAGAGKSTLGVCILREWVRSRGRGGAFVDGFQLATARAHASLGDEAPLVERAIESEFLLLDDLLAKAANPIHDASADVIHARHAANRRTIITLGFDADYVKAKLGDGIARRVFERACIIELKPRRAA